MNILCENERGYEYSDNRPYCCSNYNYAPEPGRAILNVGTGGAGPLPIISTPLSRPIPVASVSIDTSCMCYPKILLTFTSLISLPASIAVTLNFIIVRTVGDGSPQAIGGTYTFWEIDSVLEAESFAFQYCDCNPPIGNISYTVQLEPSSLIAETAGLTITNAVLSALAVENL